MEPIWQGKASVIRPSINVKIKYASIPIIRKSLIVEAAKKYAEEVVASRNDIPQDTLPEVLDGLKSEIAEDFANGVRYALGRFLERKIE